MDALFRRYCLCLLLCLAAPVSAGPWMREAGSAFLSLGAELPVRPEDRGGGYGTVYLEYGLHPRVALSLDLGTDRHGGGKALATVHTPLLRGLDPWRVSAGLGAGMRGAWEAPRPVLRPVLSFGRGIETGAGAGWIAADLSATVFMDGTGGTEPALDLTAGLDATPRLTWLVQVMAERPVGGAARIKAVPGVLLNLAGGTRLRLGVMIGTETPPTLVLGLWRVLPRGGAGD